MLNLLLAALLGGLPAPRTELHVAAKNVTLTVSPDDAIFQRYFTLLGSEPGQITGSQVVMPVTPDDLRRVLQFCVNSTSLQPALVPLQKITDTVYRIDVRSLGWDVNVWEELVRTQEPYFSINWCDPVDEKALRERTKSCMAIVRADWFLSKLMYQPFYRKFLNLPKTYPEFKVKMGVNEVQARDLGLRVGGAVLKSVVAQHNRQLVRTPSMIGYFWESRDVRTNVGPQSVLDNLFGIEIDGGETIVQIPNKLQVFELYDAKDNVLDVVPPDIAADTNTVLAYRDIRTAASCIICHDSGLKRFKDVTRPLLAGGVLPTGHLSREQLATLNQFYNPLLEQILDQDIASYAAAVAQITEGWSTRDNAHKLEAVLYNYMDLLVTPEQAALEVGVTAARLPMLAPLVVAAYAAQQKTPPGSTLALLQGTPIPRQAWEQAFRDVAVAAQSLPETSTYPNLTSPPQEEKKP